jgi:hypothetical protein
MMGTMAFQSQELFYEWQLILSASKTAHDVVVTVEWLNPDDRFSVQPPGVSISDLTPKWMSGFPEPTRRADVYSRSVRFPIVGSSKPVAQIVIRRPLPSAPISSANLIRLGGIVAGDCAVTDEQSDREADAKRL